MKQKIHERLLAQIGSLTSWLLKLLTLRHGGELATRGLTLVVKTGARI